MSRPRTHPEHGCDAGYARGCRCDECRAAHAEYERERGRARRQAAEAGKPAYSPEPDRWRPLVHGTPDAWRRNCRCGPCRQAHADTTPRAHLRKPPVFDEDQLPFAIPGGWNLPPEFVEAWREEISVEL